MLNIFAWQASQNVCAKHDDGQVSIIFPQWLDDETQNMDHQWIEPKFF